MFLFRRAVARLVCALALLGVLSVPVRPAAAAGPDPGLAAVLSQWAAGRNVAATVIELGGAGRTASVNGGTRFVTASTAKLFSAWATLRRIDAGQWSFGSPIAGGPTVGECLRKMIMLSDNTCHESFLSHIGWPTINREIAAAGFGSTTLSSGVPGMPQLSTTNDEARYLTLFMQHRLPGLSNASVNRLFWLMLAQVHRYGVPAALPGIPVVDKPGWLWGGSRYNVFNDAAVVFPHGRAPYVLVVMTNFQSWGTVQDAARRVETYLATH